MCWCFCYFLNNANKCYDRARGSLKNVPLNVFFLMKFLIYLQWLEVIKPIWRNVSINVFYFIIEWNVKETVLLPVCIAYAAPSAHIFNNIIGMFWLPEPIIRPANTSWEIVYHCIKHVPKVKHMEYSIAYNRMINQ